jgi:hypothetical protein
MHRVDAGCSADVSEIFTVSIFKAKWVTMGRVPDTHWIGGWLGPRVKRKIHVFAGNRTADVQPIARSQY